MRMPSINVQDISTFEALKKTTRALSEVREAAERIAKPHDGKPDEHSICVRLGDIRALAATAPAKP